MKTCSKCGQPKSFDDFYTHAASAFGLSPRCKQCMKETAKAARLANPEKYAAYDKARANNRDRVAARAAYAQTEAGKAASQRAKDRYVEKNRALINERARVHRMAPDQLEKSRERKRLYMRSNLGAASQARTNQRNPDRRSARVAVSNAVRDGRLVPWPFCAIPDCCNENPVAHHPDYSRPLDVVWLCQAHHQQAHAVTPS